MLTNSQTFFFTYILTALEQALSLHGATSSLQIPSAAVAEVSLPDDHHMPLSAPPLTGSALGSRFSFPWGRREEPHAAPPGPLLVQPLAARSREDRIGIALPELKLQSFGHKHEGADEVPAEPATPTPTTLNEKGPSNFFQIDSEPSKVGEVVADKPALVQANASVGDAPDLGVGFVAAAKPPPALSEVPPLPFAPDGVPLPVHVTAVIATQEISAGSNRDTKAIAALAANASVEEQAWTNFTAAEALTASTHGGNRDTEALGTDAAAEPLPVATSAPGTQPKEQTSVSASGMANVKAPLPNEPPVAPLGKADSKQAALESALAAAAKQATSTVSDAGSSPKNVLLSCLLGVGYIFMIGGICACFLGVGFIAYMWQRRCGSPTIRSQVEDLPLCSASEVERRLPLVGGYDCIFSKPLSSGQLLRLEAYIDGPSAGGSSFMTPLTGQACVLYSVAVSRQLHDGIRPAPVAFASGSTDFVISLKDAPHVSINLRAEEVSLFDMRRGRRVERMAFAAAPEKWQDFILTHRAGTEWQTSAQMRSDNSSLEFQECALLCGSLATFVGELHRGADGMLSLRPLRLEAIASDVSGMPPVRSRSNASERWRTSWECDNSEANNITTNMSPMTENDDDAHFDKVMVSDDALLLDGASSFLRRLPAKCSNHAMSLVSKYHRSKLGRSEKSAGNLEGRTL